MKNGNMVMFFIVQKYHIFEVMVITKLKTFFQNMVFVSCLDSLVFKSILPLIRNANTMIKKKNGKLLITTKCHMVIDNHMVMAKLRHFFKIMVIIWYKSQKNEELLW